MLVLSRQEDETVIISVPPSDRWQRIEVKIVDVRGDKVRLGFEADESVTIHREEVMAAIAMEKEGDKQ